ncbi:MAG: hypothetical protein OXR66_09415 [Candidatus Woesearchaeota archaeon]|nr:hypothetical protein [Candidatus Woesearchaeota archaeon]
MDSERRITQMALGAETMMKKIVTNVRLWVLVVFLILSLIAINPSLDASGVAIRQVDKNSSAAVAGIQSPDPTGTPVSRERVVEVNGIPIESVAQYYDATEGHGANESIVVTTNKNTYVLTTQAITSFDNETNETTVLGIEPLGLSVYEAPKSNIKLGLDLSGGTRVVLQPEERIAKTDLELVIENIKQRLNVYGLSDIIVRSAKDLSGDDFIIVEIAGVEKEEVQKLLASQGKFEAHVGNTTVFRGGNDITYVCRSAECSGIDRNAGCGQTAGGYACRFSFEIQLSPDAAQRQADATQNLQIVDDGSGAYLSEPLDLYLDDELVDTLQIAADLKGRAVTSILISGSGFGVSQRAAVEDAIKGMRQLQTVMITGSLPVKLQIVKSDGISPVLGSEFVKNAVLLGALSILAVAMTLVIRYRKLVLSIPTIIAMLSEVTIILGFAATVGWNMDLAAIAAIIIAIGSGVDDQILIIDETIGKRARSGKSWREKVKAAFFVIFAAYFTLAAAMLPLFFAGAGLLRGFALTTLVGVTAGVLITRPAFAQLIEILLKKE